MDNYEKLCDVLKTNTLLINDDGELLKNKVQELARKMDSSLLETLLSDSFTSEMFFTDINGVKVFDVNKFTYIVDSKAFLPDSYTRFKQNIMLTDGNKSIANSGDVVLEFPNKDCILEFDSTDTDEKRKEVFLNETLAKPEIDVLLDHKAFCNAVKHTANGDKPVTELTMEDNFIIKGNNLLALHTLYPKYKGKIKLMYWDILYNTQNDQVPYNDSFKHSSWLTMMKNRLEIGKKLLRDDGVICLQCDKNEDSYLKVLCDEIFGRENFINHICIKSSSASGTKTAHKDKTIIKLTDTLLVYKKSDEIKINPVYEKKSKWDTHYSIWVEEIDGKLIEKSLLVKLKEIGIVNNNVTLSSINMDDKKFKKFYIENSENIGRWSTHKVSEAKEYGKEHPGEIFKYKDKGVFKNKDQFSPISSVIKKVVVGNNEVYDTAVLLCDIWTDIDFNNTQNEGNNSLPSGKKPEILIRRILQMFTDENDIVLDAYLGSGTTAAVAHKMGRRYIGIEQLDSHYDMSIVRMNNVINGDQTGISKSVNWKGGGSFVTFELTKNSQKIIDRIINTKDEGELKDIYDDLINSPFVLYRVAINTMKKFKISFDSLSIDDKKKLLVSIIDKNTLYINYSDIDNEDYNSLTDSDKEFTRNFYRKE